MATREYKPTTPGRRGMSVLDFKEITKSFPEKSLLAPLRKSGGRNNNGHITMRHVGGGHKRRYRIIDFVRRRKMEVPAEVSAIEYDPNRTANIALLKYSDGDWAYILAPVGLKVGAKVIASEAADILPGNALPLRHIPLGTNIHNIELKIGKGGQMVRGAGCAAQLMAKEGRYATVKLPSGEVRKVFIDCLATVGEVGNKEYENISWGKAGRRRYLGIRPTVRGMVMNPVDHPHGGGEGCSKGGNHPSSPWGTPAKGYKTRLRPNPYLVKDRRSKL